MKGALAQEEALAADGEFGHVLLLEVWDRDAGDLADLLAGVALFLREVVVDFGDEVFELGLEFGGGDAVVVCYALLFLEVSIVEAAQ